MLLGWPRVDQRFMLRCKLNVKQEAVRKTSMNPFLHFFGPVTCRRIILVAVKFSACAENFICIAFEPLYGRHNLSPAFMD
jgi:hypothetical protein